MSKLPIVHAKQLEKLLLQLGFEIHRQKESHKFYKHPMADIQQHHITLVKT